MAAKGNRIELEIRLSLPDSVAREAEASGLLQSESLEILLREELQRRRVHRFFEAADRLAELDEAPLTEAEVEAEIQAARRQQTAPHASGR